MTQNDRNFYHQPHVTDQVVNYGRTSLQGGSHILEEDISSDIIGGQWD